MSSKIPCTLERVKHHHHGRFARAAASSFAPVQGIMPRIDPSPEGLGFAATIWRQPRRLPLVSESTPIGGKHYELDNWKNTLHRIIAAAPARDAGVSLRHGSDAHARNVRRHRLNHRDRYS